MSESRHRPPDETLAEVLGQLAALRTPPADPNAHEPVQLIFEEYGIPADVCWGCSDQSVGRWTPVSQCEVALNRFDEQGASSFLKMMRDEER